MSRTAKKTKPCGYEYWTKRPFNRCGQIIGKFSKCRTHKAERQQGKQEAANDES